MEHEYMNHDWIRRRKGQWVLEMLYVMALLDILAR
jgi:hypothetical protein